MILHFADDDIIKRVEECTPLRTAQPTSNTSCDTLLIKYYCSLIANTNLLSAQSSAYILHSLVAFRKFKYTYKGRWSKAVLETLTDVQLVNSLTFIATAVSLLHTPNHSHVFVGDNLTLHLWKPVLGNVGRFHSFHRPRRENRGIALFCF
jgi:hypothetical protein